MSNEFPSGLSAKTTTPPAATVAGRSAERRVMAARSARRGAREARGDGNDGLLMAFYSWSGVAADDANATPAAWNQGDICARHRTGIPRISCGEALGWGRGRRGGPR